MDKMIEFIDCGGALIEANNRGENICFISRGEWSDPEIAFFGKLLKYWDVAELIEDIDNADNTDWHNAAFDSYFGYSDCGALDELNDFKFEDVLSVQSVIEIEK